jgi:hypothetical protein
MASKMAATKRRPTKATKARPGPRASSSRGDFTAHAKAALARHDPEAISDAELQEAFAVVLKVYAAKAEKRQLAPYRDGAVTTTESIVAACALIRAADLNLFDVAMWFNRPPAVPRS